MNAAPTPPPPPARPGRIVFGGFLMGLANLVPGISGGTMILAVGIYDAFIRAVADVSRLKLSRSAVLFLALMAVGGVAAILLGSGVAVGLVKSHRWVMYSLFVGMTLGGAPQLVRLCAPLSPGVFLGFLAGFGVMLAQGLELFSVHLPETFPFLVVAGVLGASSMVLPGISGAYVLLIVGLYETVVGSASLGALREDWRASLWVLGPVGLGAVLGVGGLANLLRYLLARFSAPVHALLLGLLIGSVIGLWPFRAAVHPELMDKPFRRSVQMLVVDGAEPAEIAERHGIEWSAEDAARLRAEYAGTSAGDLKRRSMETRAYTPTLLRAAMALGLFVAGFLVTLLLGRGKERAA